MTTRILAGFEADNPQGFPGIISGCLFDEAVISPLHHGRHRWANLADAVLYTYSLGGMIEVI